MLHILNWNPPILYLQVFFTFAIKKMNASAEQPISFKHFWSPDIFPRWLATVCYHEQEMINHENMI